MVPIKKIFVLSNEIASKFTIFHKIPQLLNYISKFLGKANFCIKKILLKIQKNNFLWDPIHENSLNYLASKLLVFIFANDDFKPHHFGSLHHYFSQIDEFNDKKFQKIIPYFLESSLFIWNQLNCFEYSYLEDALLNIGSRTLNKLFNEINQTNQLIIGVSLLETIHFVFQKNKVLISNEGFIMLVKNKLKLNREKKTLIYQIDEVCNDYYNFCKKMIFFELPVKYYKYVFFDNPIYLFRKKIKSMYNRCLEMMVEKFITMLKESVLIKRILLYFSSNT